MQLFHLYHNNRFDKLLHSDFALFEFSIWLHVVARSLISVFIPILLLTSGYDVGQIVIYYLIYNLFDVPLNFLAQYLTRRMGARWVIALGNVFVIGFFLILNILTPDNWPLLVLMALFAALYDSFYWVAHLFLFIKGSRTSPKGEGEETGILYSIKRFARLISPALGAGILLFFSQSALIYTSVIIFALSIIPLMKVDDFSDKPETPGMSIRKFFSRTPERKNFSFMALWSVHGSAEGVLWPLFIYIVFESIQSVALVPIVVSLTSIVFSYFVGKIHKESRDYMIGLAALLIALTWIFRLSIENTFLFYASIVFVGLFSLLISIPLDSNIFSRARVTDPLGTATYRNTISMGMKVILYALLALVINVFDVSFIIAALSLFVLVALDFFLISHSSARIAH